MLHSLETAYVDTSADDLRWSLTHPEVASLTGVTAQVHGRAIALRVLGASHQVVIDYDGHRFVETVAYLPAVSAALPTPGAHARLDHAPVGSTYDITSRVDRLSPDMVHDRARLLRCRLGRESHAVVAAFPGAADAVTALSLAPARAGRIEWTTWHVYPQHQQVVRTQTRITLEEDR